ncbi:MAG: DALR anticodon-binding domain-containing protein [Microcoleaceae cyanobacterium]
MSGGYEQKLGNWENIETIPINQTRDSGKIVYKSAIALKLASIWRQPPVDIATKLTKCCIEVVNTEAGQDTVIFQVEPMSSGMIYFEITDLSVANWLHDLTSGNLITGHEQLQVTVDSRSIQPTILFNIQYSHARCCSLLRMGERDRLITLIPRIQNTCDRVWLIKTPNPIPWQQKNGQLQFSHYAECRLISQLAFTLDNIYSVSSTQKAVNWEKLADRLSAAFQNFYSQCRIWGKVKINRPELAQARLGLVLATQSVLRFLLEERLGAQAPLEL